MKHAIIIASTQRPEQVRQLLETLKRQTTQPSEIIISVVNVDNDTPRELPANVRVVAGPAGLTRQRNLAIRSVAADTRLLTFFDDDAEPHLEYLERAQNFIVSRPEVVLFAGLVVRDGVVCGTVDREAAKLELAERVPQLRDIAWPRAYGCNMNVRCDVARLIMFDERLPLYGWLEDRDFSVRCGRLGVVLNFAGCELIHLGVSEGRVSGTKLGFSQVVNAYYLRNKGVLSFGECASLISRAIVANCIGAARGDKHVDRRGRVVGNWRAVLAIMTHEADPQALPALAERY